MRKQQFIGLATAFLVTLTGTTARSQSAYFQAVTNLNPAVYFPLQETTQPPIADVETNYGSLGPVGDAIYSSGSITKGASGATADGDSAVSDSDAAGGFLAVPTTDVRTAVTNSTFTVEVWVNSAEQDRGYEGIVAKSGGNNAGINGANNQAGWCLSQNYIAYLDSQNMRGWDFHVYNGVGHAGAEVIVPYAVTNNVWYHLVATFDGQNCRFYVNGVDAIAAGIGFQVSSINGSYVPDTWNPLQIGSSRNLNGNNYHGEIDEVAIYTNVLTPSQVAAHYAAASGTSYFSTIMGDAPYMYWRMDAPSGGYIAPDPTNYPVATNYGRASDWFGLYGTACQPGVAGPQFAGMFDPNNGNASYGVAINGIGGNNGGTANVPVGYDGTGIAYFAAGAAPVILETVGGFTDPEFPVLNPTNGPGNHMPFSVTIWFQARPTDYSRFQTIFGHSDNGWRMAMNTGNNLDARWNPGPAGGEADNHLFSQNDGKWHQFVGTYDGTNVLTYMDGILVASTTGTGNGLGSPSWPILGGDPQYLNSGNSYTLGTATGTSSRTGYGQRLFSGNISQFAFFTNTLTAGQVEYLYTNAVPNQPPYLLSQPYGSAQSAAFPRINPAPAYMYEGVTANGTTPLAYQWYFNTVSNTATATALVNDGVKYADAQTSQVVVSNLVASDSGYYFCVVTNNYGAVTSALAYVIINDQPAITAQNPAADFSLFPNQQATLSVTAVQDVTTNLLSYQWYVNGVANPNGTNATFVSPGVTAAGTSFYCIVTNLYGAATSVTVSATSLLPLPAVLTNSPFGSNILALNPTAYWPMHESGETPAPGCVETNYGTLGGVADGTYGEWRYDMAAAVGVSPVGNQNAPTNICVIHGLPGAIHGDSDTCVNLMGAAQNDGFLVIPRTDNADSTIKAPFTLEAWVRPMDDEPGFHIILGEDSSDHNADGKFGGFDWIYNGTRDTFSITMRNGIGSGSVEPKTTANYPPGQWYHVVTEFDGTNVYYWINGVQDPLQTTYTNVVFSPNTWDPITIGCGRGLNNNRFRGSLDEVAVYTNLLSPATIAQHYTDGISGAAGVYKADVLAGSPLLYYRMDSPTWTPPALDTWPVLTNYGSVAVNGVYTPGSVPGGGPGPSDSGIPVLGLSANNALICDGHSTFADALNIPAFHPTGQTPFTVAAWVKGNPADTGNRNWQGFVAEGDSSWRLNLRGNTGIANFNSQNSGDVGNSTTSGISANVNDGNWHWVVGTCDGSNTTVYVDGQVSATTLKTNLNNASPAVELFLGGYPNNNVYNGNTWASIFNEGAGGGALGSDSSRVLAGSICEAAFWNGKALTPAQISAMYNSLQIAPSINRQPVSAGVDGNSSFTNYTVATGTAPLSYQWYLNGAPRSGQTNANLILLAAQPADVGNWYLVVTNNYLAVTSQVVSLNVFTNISIAQDVSVTNYTLYAGGHPAPFSILATGLRPFSYQWYENSAPIANATNSTYTLADAEPGNSTNAFYCVAANSFNTATSSVVTVTVLAVPSAIPYSQTVLADNPVGFWPLSEPDDGLGDYNAGVIAHDYWGANNGIYTNTVLGQPGFNPTVDPNGTCAQFGASLSFSDNDVYAIPTNVDFSAPNGSSSSFSVEAWVKGNFQQTMDAGIVSKGYGGGGEQFNLDCGSDGATAANGVPNPTSHSFRFFVRDASGAVHGVNSAVNPSDNLWHHLVGVCDESNGLVSLYIDGLLVGTNTIAPGSGILASTRSMLIGARPSNSTTNANDAQFAGWIQDVAVFNYALSATQEVAHFDAGDIPASVPVPPKDTVVSEFGTATFNAVVIGTPVVSIQWYDGNTSTAISGATNTTLVIPGVQFNDSYYVVVNNAYGTYQSPAANLTVVSGPPQLQPYGQDLQPEYFVPEGGTIQLPVVAYGTLPMTNQWQTSPTNVVNWVNLADSGRITGSQSNVLTITDAQFSDAGNYQLTITNGSGGITSSTATLVVGPLPLGFNGDGVGWATNGSAWVATPDLLSLTDPNGRGGNGSFFFQYPLYIGAFEASFTYQDADQGGADGASFCIQNDPRGPAALGGGGGQLGVSGITPSLELEINLYNGNTQIPGYTVHTNGLTGGGGANGNYLSLVNNGINFNSGDPINIDVYYAQGWLSLTFSDTNAVTPGLFSTNIYVGDLTQTLGSDKAYVGFTGAYGGVQSHQVITNFTFVSLPMTGITFNGTNAVVSWPAATYGYLLQQNADLATTNWTTVTNLPSTDNQQNQVVLPAGSRSMFYRLILPPYP